MSISSSLEPAFLLLTHELEQKGLRRISVRDERVEAELPVILDWLWEKAAEFRRDGKSKMASLSLHLHEEISPNRNTGEYDGFWSAITRLQPFSVQISNPLLQEMRLGTVDQAFPKNDSTALFEEFAKLSAERICSKR